MNKLIERSIIEFIDELDSSSPAPGGGSVSALSSALGVALVRMVGHLSVSKKRFMKLNQSIQDEFKRTIFELENKKKRLEELIDLDTKAFDRIMAAFKLPKETEEEKRVRKAELEEATLEAINVPLEVAQVSIRALQSIERVMRYGNKQAISDLGVAALMIASGIEGACLNVLINLPGLSDEALKQTYRQEAEKMTERANTYRDEYTRHVKNVIST
jgi:methenyltetrahydrofolate cyclohydrolase